MSDEEEGEKTYTVVFEDEPDIVHKFLPPKDGKAKATWPNGDTYEGEYKDGKRTGKGVYKLTSGASYDGDYVENKKEGFGVYISPDKGKYTGEWLNDKRHGQGTYKYPNGDTFTGYWKNGAKHGRGSYTYKGNTTTITGVWSNGQVVDGSWTSHDGGKYMGAFLDNAPAGEGVYVHANGNTAPGVYADGTFKEEVFSTPHPNTKPPEPQIADLMKKSIRSIDKAVSRFDHFNTMFKLKPDNEGVPNFRRVGATNIFGSAQPTIKGLKKLAEKLGEAGVDKTTWVSVRGDPVVYVNGLPLCPRLPKQLDETLTFSGVNNKQMIELETRMMDNIKFLTKKKGGLHEYFQDNIDPLTGEKTSSKETVEVAGPELIRNISAQFTFLAEEDETPVAYLRSAISESANPTVNDLDTLAHTIRKNAEGALVFHDADGGDRVTLAQAIALLVTNQENAAGGEEGEEGGGEEAAEGDEGDAAAKEEKKEEVGYNPEEPDFAAGQYSVVMKLVARLNGEETAEERSKREEAEEAKVEEAKEAAKAQFDADTKLKEEAAAAVAAAAAEAGEAEAAEGEAAEAPAEGEEAEAPAEGEGDAASATTKSLEEYIEEAVAAVPRGAPTVSTVGTDAKKRVDTALDKAAATGNLREQIIECKKAYEEKQSADVLTSAKAKLEAYVSLILFTVYLAAFAKAPPAEGGEEGGDEEGAEDKGPTGLTYAKWREENFETATFSGTATTGEIADFFWD